MIDKAQFQNVVRRANQAPSVHNVQPTRWKLGRDCIQLYIDGSVRLKTGDPEGLDAALSCGAALEATLLALGDIGLNAHVMDYWGGRGPEGGVQLAAELQLKKGEADPLAAALERRFTWRNFFKDQAVDPWLREDVHFVATQELKARIAERNDWASLEIMKNKAFRAELLSWMRLSSAHPRHSLDGLNNEALQMPNSDARMARWALGILWPVLRLFGATKGITSEAEKTLSAPILAAFHRPANESPIQSGRAYLRLCLEAAQLGLSGWPMAALSDHQQTNAEICEMLGIGTDRRLVQVLRFGHASGPRPLPARRPLEELIL